MENKTSVEWLMEQLIKYDIIRDVHPDNILFHKAKEMHKQEIVDAYNKGEFNDGMNETAEQYYQEKHIQDVKKDKKKVNSISEKITEAVKHSGYTVFIPEYARKKN